MSAKDFSFLSGNARKMCDGSILQARWENNKLQYFAQDCKETNGVRTVFLRAKHNGEIEMEKEISHRVKNADGEFAFDEKTFEPTYIKETVKRFVTHNSGKGQKRNFCANCRKYFSKFYTVKIPMGE